MWAAANSRKRGRGSGSNLSESEYDSDTSSDGERSTTESIHGDNTENAQPSSTPVRKKAKRKRKKKATRENPDATMARLTSSYSAAMAAVGALHRLSRQYSKQNNSRDKNQNCSGNFNSDKNAENDVNKSQGEATNNASGTAINDDGALQQAHANIQRVANAARIAFERSLLLDNVILAPIALSMTSNVKDSKAKASSRGTRGGEKDVHVSRESTSCTSSAWFNTWNNELNVKAISMAQWNRLNTAHRNTAKQISYLSLVNYADLLLCGCDCKVSNSDLVGQDILDKGAVAKLGAFDLFQSLPRDDVCTPDDGDSCRCLWKGEARDRTLRLALAAYCDASDLDSTDPTLWLKLACAARAIDSDSGYQVKPPSESFRCLERLALERGLSSLPKGVPPNRMLLRAWNEFQARDRTTANDSEGIPDIVVSSEENGPVELVLELPKYSWSALGGILLDVSRRGSPLSNETDFGSPLVDIRISPLLSIPSKVLKKIHGWLERDDALNMLLTCKSIAEVIVTSKVLPPTKLPSLPPARDDKDLPQAPDRVEVEAIDENAFNNPGENSPTKESESNAIDDRTSRRGRVSKRVQSQAITTEKQNERRAKKSSVEYCLLAGVLSSTAQNPNYRKLIMSDVSWDKLPIMNRGRQHTQTLSPMKTDFRQQPSITISLRQQNDTSAPSSLSTFIHKMSKVNSGPIDVLEQFLLHVSLHASDIFGSENADALSTCVLDSFDMITDASRSYSEKMSSWYSAEEFDESNLPLERALAVVSVNLLAAELRFKRLDCGDSEDNINDEVKLDFMVPNLMHCVSVLSRYDSSNDQMTIILELKCRYHWLASTYYTWLGRRCNDISVSKDAVELSFEYLDACLECISECDRSIRTNHLVSPDHRHGAHWACLSVDTLMNYKQYLLSTAVVSKVRQQFHDISCQLKEDMSTDNEPWSITEGQKINLLSLGTQLVNRYKAGQEQSNERTEELFDDFILTHGVHLVSENNADRISHDWEVSLSPSNGKDIWGNIWLAIPSTKTESIEQISSTSLSSPSIMQVLSCSLLLSEGDTQPLLSIYIQLISFALESRSRILHGSAEDRIERANLMLLASKYFVDKLADKMSELPTVNYELDDDLSERTIQSVIHLYQNISDSETKEQTEELNDNKCLERSDLFHSASHLAFAARQCQGLSPETRNNIESMYFVGLVKTFTKAKSEFVGLYTFVSDKRLKSWQIQLSNKTSKICFIANELAELMSKFTTCVDSDGHVRLSHLMKGLIGLRDAEQIQNESVDISPLTHLSESLLWFWSFMKDRTDASSPAETAVKDRLLVSVCAALIALCGSPGASILSSSNFEQNVNPTNSDYFDSDNSVNGVFLPDDSVENELQHSKRTLTRRYCQLTQCISLVFEFSERAACREGCYPSSQHGPFLSLVTVRTLSSMADSIFALFSEDIWGEEWPYGVRQCGSTLDSVLSKAYTSLYGFSLTGQVQNSDSQKCYAPESIMAAAQIFRSVKRVYNKHNRRSPPTKAFETMEMVLPSVEENAIGKAIRKYMFDSDKDVDAVRFSRTDVPPGFPEWVFYETSATSSSGEDSTCAEILRRGICHELAKCPISHISNDPEEGNEELSEERESTQRYELSLSRKFGAVMDDLSYDPRNIENWMTLSECLGFKADIISDRLVRDNDPYDSSDFCPQIHPKKSMATRSLNSLYEIESEEHTSRNWHPYIGSDLSPYIQYPWSNLNSLRDFTTRIGSSLPPVSENQSESDMVDLQIWKEIESLFDKKDYTSWANAWAGMFVTSLRTMRMKALRVARYLAKKQLGKGLHPSEVCEDIGTALYGDLMASTVYGFPMQRMSNHEKRAIAEGTKYYFEEAIETSKSADYACDSKTESWEVQFMIGKCCEKIASTLREEIYPSGDNDDRRQYEISMTKAIENYSDALMDAQKVEKTSGSQDSKNGGSSHGSREVLYRLHAARFKVLLSAIRSAADECEQAEIEAHRISSSSWFDNSNNLQTSAEDIRSKTWDLYVDCVQGLASCRKGVSYFHRAAYRLAQALHWAPAFHDASFCYLTGSTEIIPRSKRERISELDKDSFAECAASVIGSLFDKKRAHLVAVWVTTSAAPPPFEVLNDSVRKYDSLRLKYVMAFIDTMVLCKRRDKIETFISWAVSSSQDLPGFYEASAMKFQGGNPGKSLLFGSGFLVKVIRASTTALAKMILADLALMKQDGINEQTRKLLKDDFKLSHNLFIHLHSTREDILKAAHSNQPLDEAVAFFRCYLSIQSSRINDTINLNDSVDEAMLSCLLEGALNKAKEMFPTKKNKLKTLKRQAEQDPIIK